MVSSSGVAYTQAWRLNRQRRSSCDGGSAGGISLLGNVRDFMREETEVGGTLVPPQPDVLAMRERARAHGVGTLAIGRLRMHSDVTEPAP